MQHYASSSILFVLSLSYRAAADNRDVICHKLYFTLRSPNCLHAVPPCVSPAVNIGLTIRDAILIPKYALCRYAGMRTLAR